MYVSKYYTCEQIDQRLLQGYYDDFVDAGFVGTINEFWSFVLSIKNKVDSKEGYGLSKNDFTDELKKKLDSIEEGAKLITKVSQLENDSNFQNEEQVKQMITDLVDGADDALDTLKELAEALGNDPNFATTITNKLTELRTALTDEINRAKEEEAKLATRISEVNTQMEAHIQEVVNHIDSVVTALNTKISQVETKVDNNTKAINDLRESTTNGINSAREYANQLVTEERNRAIAAETKNSQSITDLTSTHNADKSELKTLIENEARVRLENDNTLQNNITNLDSKLTQEVSNLNTKISEETYARETADKELASNIEIEATTRQSEDNALKAAIENEATTRQSQDEILNRKIEDLGNTTNAELGSVNEKLEREIQDRIKADETKVDKIEGYSLTKNDFTDVLLNKLNGIEEKANYITKVSQLLNDSGYQTKEEVNQAIQDIIGSAPEVLDTLEEIAKALGDDPNFATTITRQLTAITQQLNDEIVNREAADTLLQEAIDAEATAREEALTALGTSNSEALAKEVEERKAADTLLQENINTEKADRIKDIDRVTQLIDNLSTNTNTALAAIRTSITDLDTKLSSEIRAKDEIVTQNTQAIQKNLELIQNLQNSFKTDVEAIRTLVQEEATARTEADKVLTESIQKVSSDLSLEASNRQSADETLQLNLNHEAELRAQADQVMTEEYKHLIEDEAYKRGTKDTELENLINSNHNTLTQQVSDLASRLSQEILDRSTADAAINEKVSKNTSDIAAEVLRATNQENALLQKITTLEANHKDDYEAIMKAIQDEANARAEFDAQVEAAWGWSD